MSPTPSRLAITFSRLPAGRSSWSSLYRRCPSNERGQGALRSRALADYPSQSGEAVNAAAPTETDDPPIPEVLPVLFADDALVLPGTVAPLLVSTPPTIALVDDAMRASRMFAVVRRRSRPDGRPAWGRSCSFSSSSDCRTARFGSSCKGWRAFASARSCAKTPIRWRASSGFPSAAARSWTWSSRR